MSEQAINFEERVEYEMRILVVEMEVVRLKRALTEPSSRDARARFLQAAQGHGIADTAKLVGGPHMSMKDAADVHAQLVVERVKA